MGCHCLDQKAKTGPRGHLAHLALQVMETAP